MKANDFRIGNLVKYNGRTFKLHSLTEDLPILNTTEFGIGVVDWNNVEAIELNKNWLDEFGFDDSTYKQGYIGIDVKCSSGIILDFVLTKPGHLGDWQNYYVFEYSNSRFVELKYVHQLQNFFFAHTQQELKFNETMKGL